MNNNKLRMLSLKLRGYAREIGHNAFANYSQKQYLDMLYELADEFEELAEVEDD